MIENDTLKDFSFDIFLPDETSSGFTIFCDLAELFGEEFNREALQRLRKLLRDHPEAPRGKLSSDNEADRVSLRASKPDVIFLVARIINDNSIDQYRKHFREEHYQAILDELRSWKRRKPKKWSVGDVFAFAMSNGEYAYGQVLAEKYGTPSCALFDCRTTEIMDVRELGEFRVISILHIGSDLLDKGTWKVIGALNPAADPDTSQHGKRGTVGCKSYGGGGWLVMLAEAYHGIRPWNVGYFGDDRYYDKMLMPGIERPQHCLWLPPEEREEYRRNHGITA